MDAARPGYIYWYLEYRPLALIQQKARKPAVYDACTKKTGHTVSLRESPKLVLEQNIPFRNNYHQI